MKKKPAPAPKKAPERIVSIPMPAHRPIESITRDIANATGARLAELVSELEAAKAAREEKG